MSLNQRVANSVFHTNIEILKNLQDTSSLSFNESPIDFGCVFSGETVITNIDLTVLTSTKLSLYIKGDPYFQATVVSSIPGPAEIPMKDFTLLSSQYIPKYDIVSNVGNIAIDPQIFDSITPVARANNAPLQATQQLVNGGLQLEYTNNIAPVVLKPLITIQDKPVSGLQKNKSIDLPKFNIRQSVNSNSIMLDANSSLPYFIKVIFNAPPTVLETYTAKLTLSFDNKLFDILLSAQTGDVIINPVSNIQSVILGESVIVDYKVENKSNTLAEITIPELKPFGGIIVPAQNFTLAANTISTLQIAVKTTTEYSYNKLILFDTLWKGKYVLNSSSKRKVLTSILPVIKEPELSFQSNALTTQGQSCSLVVNIKNFGPPTSIYFFSTDLLDFILIDPASTPIGIGASQELSINLILKISPHAPINLKGDPDLIYNITYTSFYGKFTKTQSIALRISSSFQIQAQEQTNWCWAAVSQSIFIFYGGFIPQCEIVKKIKSFNPLLMPNGDPCSNPVPVKWNLTGPINQALGILGLLEQKEEDRALSEIEIKEEIDKGRPMALAIRWTSGINEGKGHAIVISGYVTLNDGSMMVIVEDPGNTGKESLMDSNTLLTNYSGAGIWERTCRTHRP